MAVRLRDALEGLLQNWRDDLGVEWRKVLDGVEPDFAAVDGNLELTAGEVIFPGRKNLAPHGARPDSHIFRALDGVRPNEVSVVVIGQDPYQKVGQATGRSFEQGDLQDWFGQPRVSPSLRRIIQALSTSRTGDSAYINGTAGWQRLVSDISTAQLPMSAPLPLWDGWQSQGVLFINAILTFNRADPQFQFNGHGPLWKPIIQAILGHLVRRQNKSVVFVAWGTKAKDAFDASGAEEVARAAGTWDQSVTLVRRPHPNAQPPSNPPFLQGENPFQQINDALAAISGLPVTW